MLPSVDPDRIKKHLTQISIPRDIFSDYHNLLSVQNYIRSEFLNYGYEIHEHSFEFQGQSFSNLIARPPQFKEVNRFIVGAHFDAVSGTPGADDNASGVVALLEAARVVAKRGFKNNIEFAAFNAEEYGMIGSTYYAASLKAKKVRVAGMLSLEMIGYTSDERRSQKIPFFLKPFYPDTGNFIALVADRRSKKLLDSIKKAFQTLKGLPLQTLTLPAKGWLLPEVRLSDHSPFWDEGYPALLVTDTSFFRNPHYHQVSDRIETLNLGFLTKVTGAVVQTCLSCAETAVFR